MSQMLFTEEGWEDYLYWQKTDKKILSKINRLLQSVGRDGVLDGPGHPEALRYKPGAYSRRIDEKNRLVYAVDGERITIRSCRGHYDD